MSNITKLHQIDPVSEQAAQWLVKLESKEISEKDIDQFILWYQADSKHKKAFSELLELWDGLDSLALLSDVIPLGDGMTKPASNVDHGRFLPRAVWAFTFTLIFLSAFIGYQYLTPSLDFEEHYATQIGEHQRLALPDGSIIQLNTNTELSVDYNKDQRKINLVKGEAHFQVAKNPKRPFIVYAGDGTIRAVGTAFNVYLHNDRVDVLVTEGKVEVRTIKVSQGEERTLSKDPSSISLPKAVAVTAGHRVEFDEKIETVAEVTPQIIDRQLAWQRGMLIFDGVPIEEAIEEINRYNKQRIIISDPELKSIRVGGYFRSGASDAMLEIFENSFDIKVTRASEDLIILSAKDKQHL